MRGLLYHDLYMNRKIWILLGVFWAAGAALELVLGRNWSVFLYFPATLCLLPLSSISGDKVNGWVRLLCTLPNGRRNMVQAKYLVVVGTLGVLLAVELLYAVLLSVGGQQGLDRSLSLILCGLGVGLLVIELTLFVSYAFSPGGSGGVVFLFILWAGQKLNTVSSGMLREPGYIPDVEMLGISPLLGLLFLPVSYCMTQVLCRDKDF